MLKQLIYFFSLGFISLLSQVVLLRELVTWLGGDELFYALGLGAWLIFVALGSFIVGKRIKKVSKFLTLSTLTLFVCLTPLLLIGFRLGLAQFLAVGQIPSLNQSIIIIGLTLFIPGCLSGLLFYLGCRLWDDSNLAYLFETLGFFIAGVIFTFFLSQASFPLPQKINEWTLRFRYPNLGEVVYSRGSQLVVSGKDNQKSVFSDGQLIFSNQQTEFDEIAERVFAELEAKEDEILVFGNLHLANQISQRFSSQKNYFVQPNKKMFQLQKDYLDKNIRVETQPLKEILESKNFDWIILSPGSPNTLSTSRYYSLGNLELVNQSLKNDGIGVLIFDLPIAYQSREVLRFGQVIYQTFNQVFDQTELLVVEGRIVLLGSKNKFFFDSSESEQLINIVLGDRKRVELKRKFSQGNQITTKLHPLAYFYYHLFWQTIFSFKLPKLLQRFIWLIPISLVIIFSLLLSKNSDEVSVLVVLSSFILMSLETTFLFLFQTQFGSLYKYLGLIMGMFLFGMAVGVGLAKKMNFNPKLILFAYLPLGLMLLISGWQNLIPAWLVLAGLIGVVGGLVYGLSNQRWINLGGQVTYIYFMDLIGAFLGAVLTATILLPRFGYELLMVLISLLILLPHAGNFLRTLRGRTG